MLLTPLPRRSAAEASGTMLLVAAVLGSGIAAERLTADEGVRLLVNAFATSSDTFSGIAPAPAAAFALAQADDAALVAVTARALVAEEAL